MTGNMADIFPILYLSCAHSKCERYSRKSLPLDKNESSRFMPPANPSAATTNPTFFIPQIATYLTVLHKVLKVTEQVCEWQARNVALIICPSLYPIRSYVREKVLQDACQCGTDNQKGRKLPKSGIEIGCPCSAIHRKSHAEAADHKEEDDTMRV